MWFLQYNAFPVKGWNFCITDCWSLRCFLNYKVGLRFLKSSLVFSEAPADYLFQCISVSLFVPWNVDGIWGSLATSWIFFSVLIMDFLLLSLSFFSEMLIWFYIFLWRIRLEFDAVLGADYWMVCLTSNFAGLTPSGNSDSANWLFLRINVLVSTFWWIIILKLHIFLMFLNVDLAHITIHRSPADLIVRLVFCLNHQF